MKPGRHHCVAVLVALSLMHADLAWGVDLTKYFKRPDQRGAELLESGKPEQAAVEFKNSQWRGVSRYLAGQYNDAMQEFAVSVDPDAPGQADANELYNLGTAAARAGDYNQAVSSLEQALKLAPEDKNISHNLEIAKKLKDLAENQQQDQQQDQSDDSQENESEDQKSDSENSQEESDQSSNGESENQDDQSNDQNSSQNSGQNSDENNGDLNADQSSRSPEQQEQPEQEEQQQDAEALREMMQQEQQSGEQEPQTEAEAELPAQSSVSEDDQATRQWLRRIPDDASQLLRNKIRLNHIIEYPDVQDMQEPW